MVRALLSLQPRVSRCARGTPGGKDRGRIEKPKGGDWEDLR